MCVCVCVCVCVLPLSWDLPMLNSSFRPILISEKRDKLSDVTLIFTLFFYKLAVDVMHVWDSHEVFHFSVFLFLLICTRVVSVCVATEQLNTQPVLLTFNSGEVPAAVTSFMFTLTWAARHVALDSDLSLHVGLHQNSLQHKSSSHWVKTGLSCRTFPGR